MPGLKGRVGKGVFWIGSTRVIVSLVGIVSVLILARLLTPEDYGLVAIAGALLAITMSLTELSLGSALLHHPAPVDDHYHSTFTLCFIRSSIIAIAFCLAAYPIALLYNDQRLVAVVIAVGFTGALQGMTNPKLVTLSRKLVFWPDFVTPVTQKLTGVLVGVAIAYFYRSYWALVIGSAAATLVSVAMTYFIVPYVPRFRLTHFKDLMNFSIWLSMGSALNTLNSRLDQFVIGYFIGKHPLGIYTVAENLAYMPTRESTTPIAQTLFPAFATLVREPDRLRRAYQLGQSTICAIVLPVGVGFALIAHPLVLLTIGAKWLEAVPIMQILAATFALQSLSAGLQPLAMAKGETRQLFGRDMRCLAIRIPTMIAGLVTGGIMGIAIARSISTALESLINMGLVSKLIGVRIVDQIKVNVRSLGATLVMVLAVAAVQRGMDIGSGKSALILDIATFIVVGGISYVASIYLFWVMSGHPVGPETEFARLAKNVVRKLGPGRTSLSPD